MNNIIIIIIKFKLTVQKMIRIYSSELKYIKKSKIYKKKFPLRKFYLYQKFVFSIFIPI